MSNKPWTVDRLVGELNQWDCHQGDECECPHRYCDTLCSGKVADQCQAEVDGGVEDEDIPGCHPETCGQAQLEALLAVVRGLLESPTNRYLADAILKKHLVGEE